MCVLIDTNCFAAVFNSSDAKHVEFAPVLRWIREGDGKMVYGGSKYRAELKRAGTYRRLFVELARAGKVVDLPTDLVDKEHDRVAALMDPTKHDDPHLPAIVAVSGCPVVCTQDKRSHSLLKDRSCYPSGCARPKIYGGKRNAGLLRPGTCKCSSKGGSSS